MASYRGRVGVVSDAIDTIRSAANNRVPHAAPVSTAFLTKDEEYVIPFQVKNNTYYSKPRPIGNNDKPTMYNYVPLNQKPEECVNQFNAPLYFPPKLEFSDTSNKFMEASAMRGGDSGYENHVEVRTLEQMIRTH